MDYMISRVRKKRNMPKKTNFGVEKNSNEDDFLPDVIAVQKFPLSLCLMV